MPVELRGSAWRRRTARAIDGKPSEQPRARPARRRPAAVPPPARRSTATPALVTPLPKRSTHIQPPSNTWCSAASSIGYGGDSPRAPAPAIVGHLVAPRDVGEVREERLRARDSRRSRAGSSASARLRKPRGPVASTTPARVDRNGRAAAAPAQHRHAVAASTPRLQLHFVDVLRRRAPPPRAPGTRPRRRAASACRTARRCGLAATSS